MQQQPPQQQPVEIATAGQVTEQLQNSHQDDWGQEHGQDHGHEAGAYEDDGSGQLQEDLEQDQRDFGKLQFGNALPASLLADVGNSASMTSF
jgi:hypothetical protein